MTARLVLPPAFVREFSCELEDAFALQYRTVRNAGGVAGTVRFWIREMRGLLTTAVREYREGFAPRHRRSRRRVRSPHPKRNRDMLSTLRKDLVYALRMIVKTPVVAAIAVLSLAIGVAANTTIFSILHSWMLRPLPYPEADRIVLVWENNRNDADDTQSVAAANFFDWRDEASSFDEWIVQDFKVANLTGIDRPEQLRVTIVTPNYFSVLGAPPMLGRGFRDDEGRAGSAPVAVMGEMLWRNRFGASPNIVGQTITVDGESYTVVGVMPETFDFLLGNVSLWTPSDFEDRRENRERHALAVTARLDQGVTPNQAQNELAAIASRLEQRYPDTNADWGVNVQTIRDAFPGPTDRALVQILMIVVFLVLIVACVNIASLLLAKTDARQKEMAIRVALGAGRRRLIQQLMTESVVLALIAGVLGTVLSVWGVKLLVQAIPPEMPRTFMPRLDGSVLAFAAAISVVAGLTFGITPAAQAVSGNLRTPLVEGSRGGTATKRKKRMRSFFVITEFALSLTILIGAAALTDLFQRRLDIDAGFDPENLLTMAIVLPVHKYEDDEARVRFIDEMERRLDGIPSSEGYAMMNVLPRTRNLPFTNFTIDGQHIEENEEPSTSWLSVNPTYFQTMGISLRQGRVFTGADRAETPPVVLINQRMVDRFFPEANPVGGRITVRGQSREIVGVVNNIAQQRLTGLQPDVPSVYFPLAQRPVRGMRIVLRGADPLALAVPTQTAIWAFDPDQPISDVQSMQQHLRVVLAGPTVLAQILFVVGFLALSLAAIGIYGVMAYSVSQQTSEIGIRMALGAKPLQVLGRITRQGATLAGIGVMFGVPSSFVVVRLISRMLSRGSTEGLDTVGGIAVMPIVAVSLVLVGVGLVACYLPARRATKIDPVRALQYE